jgi:polyphosphate kinase
VIDLQLADTALAWELGSDGSWSRVQPPEGAEPLNSQEQLMEYVSRQARAPGA